MRRERLNTNYKRFILNEITRPLAFQIYTRIDRFLLLHLNFKTQNLKD